MDYAQLQSKPSLPLPISTQFPQLVPNPSTSSFIAANVSPLSPLINLKSPNSYPLESGVKPGSRKKRSLFFSLFTFSSQHVRKASRGASERENRRAILDHLGRFLLSFFFYIDGVYAIIDMATAYGTALGLDTTGLLIALLVTQIVAFPFSILFGRLSGKHRPEKLIIICIAAYLGITVFALFMSTQLHFWILAVCVGMFQGGIQALSRSYFAKIIPAEKSGEYYGIMDICGKGASFLGTTLIGIVSQLTGSVNKGIGVLIVTFTIGLILFIKASSMKEDSSTKKTFSV